MHRTVSYRTIYKNALKKNLIKTSLPRTKRKNKYNAIGNEYNGRWYHSKKEASYAAHLDLLLKAGEIKEVIPQFKIDIKINGKHWRNYAVDFRVVTKHDEIQYHEVKGFETEEWRMKWDALHLLKDELLEPGAELIVIK